MRGGCLSLLNSENRLKKIEEKVIICRLVIGLSNSSHKITKIYIHCRQGESGNTQPLKTTSYPLKILAHPLKVPTHL